MKKLIITLGLWFLVTGLWGQNSPGARVVSVSQVIQKAVGVNNYSIHVGLPFLGDNSVERINNPSFERKTKPLDIRFPWGVLYLYSTFAEESFDISKGYFGDKILINWDIRSNFDLISNIRILRREYKEYANEGEDFSNKYVVIASVAKSQTSYEDKYVEGGVLYQYKIVAVGVSATESLYKTYITGIGYRNPTAIVTGNVNYKGGNPVKDVVVKANSEGSIINEGSSLNIPATGKLKIEGISTLITNATTLQAWVKPGQPFTTDSEIPINLFRLSNASLNAIDVSVNLLNTSNKLLVNIGGSIYELNNYYPSGKLNSRGDDILVPVSNFNSNFVHFSVVMEHDKVPLLYINGRAITQAYKILVNTTNLKLPKEDPAYLAKAFDLTIPTQTTMLSIDGKSTEWNSIYIGGQNGCLIDEIRVWKTALNLATIRTDFSRYISGNDARLVTYLRCNEKTGSYAYDLSRNGFNYNKNHGQLWETTTPIADKVVWAKGSGNFPASDQLGILGVTNSNGNYEIAAIPYSGTGESFTITPLYGVHQFDPKQQLVFLGQGSEVVNKISFTDISSFSFKGKILYDTRGVFKSFVELDKGGIEGDTKISGPGIVDEGYNFYQKGNEKYSKGEYWYNNNNSPNDDTDDYLERYARIASEGVNIYVDGNIVLDENNMPVVSDSEGNFDVQVPIGKHYITLKKEGHIFEHNSRYPAETGTFKEFFEHSNEPVVFIDNTRVTLVGRVVGGPVQGGKVIGFGGKGIVKETITDSTGIARDVIISSKNNIGIADITLGYKPGNSAATETTKFNFSTNTVSGEYRVSLLPLNYQLQANDIKIRNAESLSILKPGTTETIDVSKAVALTTPTFIFENGDSIMGDTYHYEKNFVYRSTPILKVNKQTSDKFITIDDIPISTDGFEYPIYTQFRPYEVGLDRFERYSNNDVNPPVEDLVPVIDGQLIVNNNLALVNSEKIEVNKDDGSKLTYTFKAGLPSISKPFTRSCSLKYRINGIDYNVENYRTEGIVLGGHSDGSQTFVTAAPDMPDIILRDPPGSNSFASIEKGTSISVTTERSFAHTEGASLQVHVSSGACFKAGGGLAGPVIEAESVNSIDGKASCTYMSKNGNSLTKTYTFNQTISTSDNPDYVGSDGDLYIGNSTNYFYGSYDDIQPSVNIIGGIEPFILKNINGDSIFVSKQKAVYFVEEPSETFFIFSQKHILSTLIPEYELFISNIEKGLLTEGVDGTLTISEYKEQIRLWKKVILDNEKSKYFAKSHRKKYKTTIANVITNFKNEITTAINKSSDPLGEYLLRKKLDEIKEIQTWLDTNFAQNISFDAGVGEITQSNETNTVTGKTSEHNIDINEELQGKLGFKLNSVGVVYTATGIFEQQINTTLNEEIQENSKFSYTLKDNDPANLLSVDVVNAFDGNGPIFITQGGRTSCPYEDAEESKFFNKEKFDIFSIAYFDVQDRIDANQKKIQEAHFWFIDWADLLGLIDKKEKLLYEKAQLELDFSKQADCCPTIEKAPLSFATQRVEVPKLSVEVANISNVLAGKKAEFKLILENNSTTETDAVFRLNVDNISNQSQAEINLEPNGTLVNVPYGKKIYYSLRIGMGPSDEYNYENIRIVLESLCDGEDVSSAVMVSVHFIPTCSEVVVSSPLNNWVYNRDAAYNIDKSTKPLKINMIGFNKAFASFKKIDLEYRLSSSPNWNRLHTYYSNKAFYDAAGVNAETEISLIESPTLEYSLDVVGLKLQDANYEIRARSTCTNGTEFISEVISGRVDLNAPRKFGTPLPIDGILGAGEDLKVSFDENIFYNSAVSSIEIKGQTNQLPINHNVSVYFEGVGNTVLINNPKITSGDLTLEFWMNNSTKASKALIMNQNGGLVVGLDNGNLYFSLGGVTAKGAIFNDNLFHHYTLTHKNSTGEISIYQDDKVIGMATGNANLQFSNNNELTIGGGDFTGNIHDLRIWEKTISLENAYARRYDKLIGNEANLIGYWPMDEGRGDLAKDLSRYKHAVVKAAWDIKPKGTSYEFANGQYLELNNVGFVQLTKEMDATISFWLKTENAQEATLFSNGRGDASDIIQSNGLRNKWAINMTAGGKLTLESEGNLYMLTSQNMADNAWHHVTLLFNRIGSLRTYVDAQSVSTHQITNIGGFSGNKIWLGGRGCKDLAGNESVDRTFSGKIDEFRLWNTLRNVEQESRDRFNEVDINSIGLLLYARMNKPDPSTGNGPGYYHAYSNQTVISSNAVLSTGNASFSNDVPAIKPERALIKFLVSHVINKDEMILEPVVTDWASLEGQVVDITVHRMIDDANNMQQSPITWTAYIKRNEMIWYAEGYNEIVDIVKNSREEKSFEITVLNKGGKGQSYNISNIPGWLKLSNTSGTIGPDSKTIITAIIDKDLSAGAYLENLYLQTDFGYDEKLQIKLRALAPEPDWAVDPTTFNYSMNIIGKIKVDGKFSEDSYDKIAALCDGKVRGSVNLVYNQEYQGYYAYLTLYSNSVYGEKLEFKIWDASKGKILSATINSAESVTFKENDILGTLSIPVIFENTAVVEQELSLNKGWTWISLNVNDPNFRNIDALTKTLQLETNDRMLSHSPALLETYYKNESTPIKSGWSGSISSNGGLSSLKMYKVNFANKQSFNIKGNSVDILNWEFPIKENWNWLPYPLSTNQPTNEALAYFDASDGDVIKSQNLFAIFDPIIGWKGTLTYLKSGVGYMIKSIKNQSFKYPGYLENSSRSSSDLISKIDKNNNDSEISSKYFEYPETMNAVVQLPEGFNELLVYDNRGILKGNAFNQEVNNNDLCFITIYGDSSEYLALFVSDGLDKKAVTNTFSFSRNDVLGTIAKPVVLEVLTDNITVFPNPFDNELFINVNSKGSQTVTIQLFNMFGQLIFVKELPVEHGINRLKIKTKVGIGTHLLKVVMEQNTVTTKVVKK